MGINVGETLMGLVTTSGIYQYLTNPLALIMVAIACVLLYLAIVKQFEPLLLLPIAFGMLLTNLLGSDIFHEELFAGGHANWALFGGAVLIDGKDFVDSVGYMVNAAGQILTGNNVVLGHFVNAVTIDDPTKLVPFADILAQFAANGNAASIILEDAFLKNGAVYTATGAMLATAGAFHSPLMQPAAEAFSACLEGVVFDEPKIPLVCNVDARPLRADDAAAHLVAHLTSPVLFSQSVAWLVEQGVDTFVECGTGGVLVGLVRRVDKSAVRMRIESRKHRMLKADARLRGKESHGVPDSG